MVKRYRLMKRGRSPAVAIAQQLREAMRARFVELIGHALIVLIEDHPLEPEEGTDPLSPAMWNGLVMSAGVMVHTSIVSGKWFTSQMGLLVDLNRSHPEFCLYGPEALVNLEFDPLLEASVKLIAFGEREQYAPDFAEFVGRCVMFEVSSDLTLNWVVSQKVNELLETGQSYVKAPSYRQHKKMIHALQSGGSTLEVPAS